MLQLSKFCTCCPLLPAKPRCFRLEPAALSVCPFGLLTESICYPFAPSETLRTLWRGAGIEQKNIETGGNGSSYLFDADHG